jgi:type III restriction enzyme
LKKGVGYIGYGKSIYEQTWFDSAPEKAVAAMLDGTNDVTFWVRLLVGDVPIAWEGGNYNPDFIAVEAEGTHWIVEVKSDKDAEAEAVKGKRKAAQKWANHVSAASAMKGTKWRYLFAREKDISDAKGSWPALKGLGL